MLDQRKARQHLDKAVEEIRAYRRESVCGICADDAEPYEDGLRAVRETDEALEAVVRERERRPASAAGPALAKTAGRIRDEARGIAVKEGAMPAPSVPVRPGTPPKRRGFLQLRPGEVIRESMGAFRQSVRLVPRPGRILRGEYETEEKS